MLVHVFGCISPLHSSELISLSFPVPKVFLNLFYPLSWLRTCLCVTMKPGSSFTVLACSRCPGICVCSSAFTEPQPDSASIISPPLSLLQSVCLYSRPEPWLCNTLPVASVLPVFQCDHVCLPDLTCLSAYWQLLRDLVPNCRLTLSAVYWCPHWSQTSYVSYVVHDKFNEL